MFQNSKNYFSCSKKKTQLIIKENKKYAQKAVFDTLTQSITFLPMPPTFSALIPHSPGHVARAGSSVFFLLLLLLSLLSLSWPPAGAMDALLQIQTSAPSSMAKRPCPSQNPRIPTFTQMDLLLDAFLGLSDSSSICIDLSFERLLDSMPSDLDQTRLIDRALKMGTFLLEAGKRSARKRATKHNSVVWALPPDLTIKVCSSFVVFFYIRNIF